MSYPGGENPSATDLEEPELVARVSEQIEVNRMKVARLRSLILIERIHAVVGGICLCLLATVLGFALVSTFYPQITQIDISAEVLVAFIIPSIILSAYGLLIFFTSAIARIHELGQLKKWNLRIIQEANSVLDGGVNEGVALRGSRLPNAFA